MNVTLVERRSVVRRLPHSVAVELATRFPHVVEIVPTLDHRRYTLTARGYVGFLRLGEHTVEIRPKLPWEHLKALFRLSTNPDREGGGDVIDTHGPGGPDSPSWLDLLAGRLAELMLERAAAGLYRDYAEREAVESHVRGRIDLPKQLRNQWRQPGLFDQVIDEFTPDTAWNRYPKSIARRLAAEPGLTPITREALSRALAVFADVSDTPVSQSERDGLWFDDRTEPYRELFDWCDLFEADEVLVSLERAFERYVMGRFREAVGADRLATQSSLPLVSDSRQTLTLTPDLVVTRDGTPVSVWDAKWKRPEPTADDVHQVLAYAAVLGVPTCGLVYPGTRFRVETLRPAGDSPLSVQILRLPLTADPVRNRRTEVRLRRAIVSGA